MEDGIFAAADFWAPANSTQFYSCQQGFCAPQGTNASWDGHCREGHMGVLCGACKVSAQPRPTRGARATRLCLISYPFVACLLPH